MSPRKTDRPSDSYHPQTVPPEDRLVEWYAISVRRYASGQCRATKSRLNPGSNAVVFEALADPTLSCHTYTWGVTALLNAANEMALDEDVQQSLW